MKLEHAQDLAQDRFFICTFFFSYPVVVMEPFLATPGTIILSDDLALALKEKMLWQMKLIYKPAFVNRKKSYQSLNIRSILNTA